MHSSTLTTAPVDMIVVKGCDAVPTEHTRPEYQQQPSDLGGWHTSRLGPGSGAGKWDKEIAVFQSPLASNKDSTLGITDPSGCGQAGSKISQQILKGLKKTCLA